MRAVAVVASLVLLLGVGSLAIHFARTWRLPEPTPQSATAERLSPESDDPHAPPRRKYRPPLSPTGPWPVVEVEPQELDFGRIAVGGIRERRVVIANTGSAPLEISQGDTTCEATLSDRPGETLEPGERRGFVVRWSPSSATEGEDQTLEIHTNDPQRATVKLRMRGRAAIPLAIVPNSVWELPPVEGQARVERLGWLTSNLVTRLEVSDLVFDRELLEITTRPIDPVRLTELEALSGVELSIALKPSRVYGVLRVPLKVRVRVPEGGTETASAPDGTTKTEAEAGAKPAGAGSGPSVSGLAEGQADVEAETDAELRPIFPEAVLLVTAVRKGPIVLVGPGYDAKQGIAGFGAFSASEGAELPLTMLVREAPAGGLELLDCESDPPGLTATLTALAAGTSQSRSGPRERVDGPGDPGGESTGGESQSERGGSRVAREGVSRYRLVVKFPAGGPAGQRLVTNPGSLRLKLNHAEVQDLVLPLHFSAH